MELVRASFKRLNIDYAPVGATVGAAVAGPQGAALGASLGVGIFVGCVGSVISNRIAEVRHSGEEASPFVWQLRCFADQGAALKGSSFVDLCVGGGPGAPSKGVLSRQLLVLTFL